MTFADDVRAGLTAPKKWLPPKYFYDEVGSALFEAITLLPEYYLTRAEGEILRDHAGEVIEMVGGPVELVELGSGSAVKTRHLIDAVLAKQPALRFCPIDISSAALDASARALASEYPQIIVEGINADYLGGLARLSRNGARRRLALFLGSNIGNFEPKEADATLRALRDVLEPGDGFLLGADRKKDPKVLERAYDDAAGVTAAFNRNVLARINRELGGQFDLETFSHRALYNQELARVEMHLVSAKTQDVAIEGAGFTASFAQGESIHTESAYKFDDRSVEALAKAADFTVARAWSDPAGRFADHLLVAN